VTSFESSLSASPDTSTTPVYFDAANHEIRVQTISEAHVGGPYTYTFTADFTNSNAVLVSSTVYTLTLNIISAIAPVAPVVDPPTTPSDDSDELLAEYEGAIEAIESELEESMEEEEELIEEESSSSNRKEAPYFLTQLENLFLVTGDSLILEFPIGYDPNSDEFEILSVEALPSIVEFVGNEL
jgi:hypothetical protein